MKHTLIYMVHLLCACTLLLATAGLAGCKKFVTLPPPPDVLVSSGVFTDDAKATGVVTSIYGSMINGATGFSNGAITLYAGMAADELSRFNPSLAQQEFITNELSPTNAIVANTWTTLYKHVYYANAAIEGMEAATALSPALKNQLLGECKFIRAFCYFYLVNLWGDVPLVLTTDYRRNQTLPRAAVADVYAAVKKDLLEAKEALLLVTGTDRTRPSKGAAAALLARVNLYNGEWGKAEAEATAVIGSGLYTPLGTLAGVFLANAKEAIFQLAPTAGFMKETQEMRPLGTLVQTILTPALVASFAPGDARRSKWIDSVTVSGNKYYYAAKYRNTASAPAEYYTLLRVAELYLIRAEARAKQADWGGALADLNVVHTRAGLAALPSTLSPSAVEQAIEAENRLEFFAEWGHRWLDLKRWNRADAVLGALKPSWQPTDARFPLPQDDILTNPFLVQNPGY